MLWVVTKTVVPFLVGLDASAGDVRVVLYKGAEHVDCHRADYALSLLRPFTGSAPEIIRRRAVSPLRP